jgi:hypothetical protein
VCQMIDEESGSVIPLNLTADLKSGLIGGLLGCDQDQANVVPNDNETFFDLRFMNAPVDVSVASADSPLLNWTVITTRRMRTKCKFVVATLKLWKVELALYVQDG